MICFCANLLKILAIHFHENYSSFDTWSLYSLNLKSISVNGVMLQIDPAIFATSSYRGALIDSGTTLAYLPEVAYDAFVDGVSFT
ncbi:hypothetical protein RIF29_29441 [Crotalaria pallida]|uniref:Xylanase inhibitor C-terminal domain-containing protein n=1 Tax=Crotalaria pallida TaxID=3830 RepID=A0AAN9EEV4_CROPI